MTLWPRLERSLSALRSRMAAWQAAPLKAHHTARLTRVLAWGGGAALLLALGWWLWAPQPVTVDTALVTQGPFERTVSGEGRTRVKALYRITAPVAGQLQRLPWREGDAVTVGAVLAELQPSAVAPLDARSQAELNARLQAAEAALARARTRVASAEQVLASRQQAWARSTALRSQGFVSDAALDAERDALRLAEQALAGEHQTRAQVEAERDQVRALLMLPGSTGGPTGDATGGAAGKQPAPGLRRVAVRAPVTGRVLRVLQPSGGPVGSGAVLLELADTRELEVVLPLLTTDAARVTVGGAARISHWGEGPDLPARVQRVEPGATKEVTALGVEEQRTLIHLDFTEPLPAAAQALGDAWAVQVTVILERQPAAVRVPTGALVPMPPTAASPPSGGAAGDRTASSDPTNRDEWLGVFCVEGPANRPSDRVRWVPIRVAGRNSEVAWVREGLLPGQRVVLYPPPNLADGARIRLRAAPGP